MHHIKLLAASTFLEWVTLRKHKWSKSQAETKELHNEKASTDTLRMTKHIPLGQHPVSHMTTLLKLSSAKLEMQSGYRSKLKSNLAILHSKKLLSQLEDPRGYPTNKTSLDTTSRTEGRLATQVLQFSIKNWDT